MSDGILTTLQALVGGALVMSTEQLAKCLLMNPKVISRMRQDNRFPIPHKVIGQKKIVYPIQWVANYLSSSDEEASPPTKLPDAQKPLRGHKRSVKAELPDLSRKMLTRCFLSFLEAHRASIEHSIKFLAHKDFADDLNDKLSNKQSQKLVGRGAII